MLTRLNTDIDEFSALVDCVYQGATDVSAWPNTAKRISEWLGTKTCLIFTPQHGAEDGGFAVNHAFNVYSLFEAKYRPHNIWDTRAFERGLVETGRVIRDQDLHTEEEFLNSVLYKELLAPADIGRMIAGVVFSPNDNDGKLVVFACHRPFNAPFSEVDAEKLSLLLPHLSRALGVMFKLRDAEFRVANSMHALDHLSRGVLLFNNLGQVCHANASAKTLLALKDGLQLSAQALPNTWQLKASDAKTQTALEMAISEAVSPDVLSTSHFSQALKIARPSGKASFILSFSSLGEQHEFSGAHLSKSDLAGGECEVKAIAFIYDADQPIALNKALLKETFELSKVELKVADLLVNGFTLEQTANALEVSVNTAKTHLKHIHSKTNTHNRAKLVKLLMHLSGD